MERRTDLALEAAEQPVRQEALTDEDVERDRFVQGRAALTRIRILSERGERALGKPRGTYITAELPALTDNETELEETARLIGGSWHLCFRKRGPCWSWASETRQLPPTP